MVNAVIVSGDRGEDGYPKALIKIGSKYMVEYLITALRDSGCVDKIYMVGDEILEKKLGASVDGYVSSGTSIPNNLIRGVKAINDYERGCIVCTSDIPMVKGDAIRDFVETCQKRKLELGYPIIDKKLNDNKYPEVKRTYVKMKEGTFTGGNIIYIDPKIAERCEEKAEEFVKYRKKPLKLGRILGISFLLRLSLGILTIEAVEKKMRKIFDLYGSAVITQYPEIGNDVDKPGDIEFVNKYLNA